MGGILLDIATGVKAVTQERVWQVLVTFRLVAV